MCGGEKKEAAKTGDTPQTPTDPLPDVPPEEGAAPAPEGGEPATEAKKTASQGAKGVGSQAGKSKATSTAAAPPIGLQKTGKNVSMGGGNAKTAPSQANKLPSLALTKGAATKT